MVTDAESDLGKDSENAGEDNAAVGCSILSDRMSPRFPDETKLHHTEMEFIFHGVTGLSAVVRLLNRSRQLREDKSDFNDEAAQPLQLLEEHNLWCAAVALGQGLKSKVDDLYDSARRDAAGVKEWSQP